MRKGFDEDGEGLIVLEEAERPHRFKPDTRMRVLDLNAQQVERPAHAVTPVAKHARGRGTGMEIGRGEQSLAKVAAD